MKCTQCSRVFQVLGDSFDASLGTVQLLERIAGVLVEEFRLKGCNFRLISRDRKVLEPVASFGLSRKFLDKGPVDAERSVAEALEGRMVVIDDARVDPRIQYPHAHAEEGIVTLLTVPLASRGQVIGVMRLSTAEPRVFSPEELDFFRITALFCSSAVVHTMFHQILEHVSQTIRSSLDLDDVLRSITEVVTEDLRAKGCTIRLLDSSEKQLELRAAFGLSSRYLENASAAPGPGVWKALEGSCVAILDAGSDPLVGHPEEALRERITSMLFVPMMVRDRAIGVLSLYTHRQYQFSEDEIHLMQAIGEQCALAIRNAQMYATIKRRYESVVDEFQQWFEHYCVHPGHASTEPHR
jgi:GAF domain-containing protein